MKHLITNVDTYIKARELFVSFFVDNEWWEPFVETSFNSLIRSVGQISVFELELLEGCYLESSSFYKQGERKPGGAMAYEENTFHKTYKVTYDAIFEERRTNKKKLLTFQSIYDIEVSQKNSKEPYVKIRTTDNRYYFTKLNSFKSLVGLHENEFNLLKGAFISPIMYQKGGSSEYNGRFNTITEDNKLVATFNIRIEGTIDNNYNLYGDVTMKNEREYSSGQRYDGDDSDDSSFRPSHEKYNGYGGFDDDTIDNAFEGDPEATWNVD